MPILIECPNCQRQLRVQDELVGRRVKCPSCGTAFPAAGVGGPQGASRAPASQAPPISPPVFSEPPPPPPEQVEYTGDEGGYGDDDRRRRSRKKKRKAVERVKLPAIFLIILGSLGALAAIFGIIVHLFAITIPFVAGVPDPAPPPGFNQPRGMNPQQAKQREEFLNAFKLGQTVGRTVVIAGGVVGLVCNALMIIGSIQMLRLRTYGLAVTATIMAFVGGLSTCLACGCPGLCFPPLYIGIGIWALVVIMSADVKAAFG